MTRKQLLLIQLSEELSEVQVEISKAQRFGLDGINPTTKETNLNAIIREFTDILAVLDEILFSEQIMLLPISKKGEHYRNKRDKIVKYLEYSKAIGILNE